MSAFKIVLLFVLSYIPEIFVKSNSKHIYFTCTCVYGKYEFLVGAHAYTNIIWFVHLYASFPFYFSFKSLGCIYTNLLAFRKYIHVCVF